MAEQLLKLTNLSVYYTSASSVVAALVKINLTFERGEFVAITGESGSGKTTMLGVLGALLPFHDGELYCKGAATSHYDTTEWEEYRKKYIGNIFQHYNLISSYSVIDNVKSTLIISGVEESEAVARAEEILKKVGLDDVKTRRASRLSSGQKQRLSIARALAKDADIIVADEPTGNLDTENGRQIIKLLRELSKDRLVIMVTHNYDEAEAYVSRKIRLHDGRIMQDIQVNERAADCESEKTVQVCKREAAPKIPDRKIIKRFAQLNCLAQPQRVVLITLFFALIAMASFTFLGSVLRYSDDAETKYYDNSAFINGDRLRISVKNYDGGPVTNDQIAAVKQLDNVVSVEEWDILLDTSCYYRYDKDYYRKYTIIDHMESGAQTKLDGVVFEDDTVYMRSAGSLKESDLLAGRLPQNAHEIVIYSDDESVLNTEREVYFRNINKLGRDIYYGAHMKVVGILNFESEIAYFHEDVARSVAAALYYPNTTIFHSEPTNFGYYTTKMFWVYPFVDPNLTGDNITVSKELFKTGIENLSIGEYSAALRRLASGIDVKRLVPELGIEQNKEVEYLSFNKVVGVSKEVFDKIFGEIESRQITVFISDYAYMDDALAALERLGMEAISPFRAGSYKYNEQAVEERKTSLILSLSAFGASFFLEVIVMMTLLRLRKNDYSILRSIGMSEKVMRGINYTELMSYQLVALLIAAVGIFIVWMLKIEYFMLLFRYYRLWHGLIIAGINLFTTAIIIWVNNNYLARNTVLK